MSAMRRHSVTALAAVVVTACVAVGLTFLFWATWPYQGIVVGPPIADGVQVVAVGGTVSWVNTGYCNHGYDVLVTRWADKYVDGRRTQSYSLPPVQFYTQGAFCADELPTVSVLPNYVKPGDYIIRSEVVYRPNPLFARVVEASSPMFTVVP